MSQVNVEELIRAAEHHHEQYIQALRNIQHATPKHADNRSSVHQDAMTPPLRALSHPTFISPDTNSAALHVHDGSGRTRRTTLETTLERPSCCPSPCPKPVARSTISRDSVVFIPDEELSFIPLLDAAPSTTTRQAEESGAVTSLDITSRTQRLLSPMSFTDDMLTQHLRETEFDGPMTAVLEEVIRRRPDMDGAVAFRDFATFERESYVSTTFEVYEIAGDASARKISIDADIQGYIKYNGDGAPYESPDGIVDAPTVWETIKDVNTDGRAVGRITIVQEPTPLILAALHLTMAPYFDMPELLNHLLSELPNRGRSHAVMHRAFERPSISASHYPASPFVSPALGSGEPTSGMPILRSVSSFANVRQRSFFFVFKYYTAVADGLEAAPWQRFDKRPFDKRLDDHIDIAECSSVLALSLGGEPTKPLRMRPRRERAKEGFLFDTFGSWQLLSIQSFPDDQHTVRDDEFTQKSFYNGPYAFLDLLISEYKDAGKRNQILHGRITKLITPPPEFMFDGRLRDKLLFEDKHFTYIRRYFWAYNTLAVINTGIKAMVAAYFDTFTDDFWAGSHPLLWPHPAPQSPEGEAYRDKMAMLRRELEKVVAELVEVLKRNERTRKEIENLRDQLFSGSSIKESRRAVDQGDNIRILTMISMIFLPLTFVTSVFGITEFTIPATDWRFALTMVLVCIPFMALIFLLQTRLFTVVVAKAYKTLVRVVTFPLRSLSNALEHDVHPDNRSSVYIARGRKRRLMMGVAHGRAAASARWKWPWGRRYVGEGDLGRV